MSQPKHLIATLAVVMILCLWPNRASAQATGAGQPQSPAARSQWKFYPSERAVGDGGPAPKRDLSGTWAGPGSGAGVSQFAENEQESPREKPVLTPYGQQLMSRSKPLRPYGPAGTNDAHVRYCDPFGFPQNMLSEIRGVSFAVEPSRVVVLVQYMDVWREIWTDGRSLPSNVDAPGKDSPNPRFNGYSVGHWEDDYTFVVDTTGIDDRTWLTAAGYPHTINAHIQERYTRLSHNDLKLTITVDDPQVYAKPFSLGTVQFRWIPNQQTDEWLCVPSELQEYLSLVGDPAGSDPAAEKQGR